MHAVPGPNPNPNPDPNHCQAREEMRFLTLAHAEAHHEAAAHLAAAEALQARLQTAGQGAQ